MGAGADPCILNECLQNTDFINHKLSEAFRLTGLHSNNT